MNEDRTATGPYTQSIIVEAGAITDGCAGPASMFDQKTCYRCGLKVDGLRICPDCGTSFHDPESRSKRAVRSICYAKRVRRRRAGAFALLALLACIIAAAIALLIELLV